MNAERLFEAIASVSRDCADCRAVYLVGGAVRDQLLGHDLEGLRDLDLVVEGDAIALAELLVERLGGSLDSHRRFGTASWRGPLWEGVVDLVSARSESYPRPGQLPEVAPAPLLDDLLRRDFTVNAMARLLSAETAELIDPSGGAGDLALGLLRIPHPGSFVDDPTRILRLARLAVRLDFGLEDATEQALRSALAEHVFDRVSGERLWAEWCLIFEESDPLRVLVWMQQSGVASSLFPAFGSSSLTQLKRASRRDVEGWSPLLSLAALLEGADPGAACARLGLYGGRARLLSVCVQARAQLLPQLLSAADDEALERLLGSVAADTRLFLSVVAPQSRAALARYEGHLLPLEPLLRGEDLVAAGMEPGRAIGAALRRVRGAQLRGEVTSPDQALRLLALK